MSRTVFCRKYQKDLPALEKAPMPGALGEEIFNHLSQQAWNDWLAHQTRLINEKHLNMMNKEDRAFINQQRDLFINNQDFEQAEGYVPENNRK